MKMNNLVSCPACRESIVGERFVAPRADGVAWYKFERLSYRCPHCGAKLSYDRATYLLIAVLGVSTAAFGGLVIFGVLPAFLVGAVPPVLVLWFFRVRRIVAKSDDRKPVPPSASERTVQ